MPADSALDHVSRVWARSASILVDRGEGAWLYDMDGRRYLDFTCGIGVTNTGHCHPAVVAAAQAQVARLIHGQANIVYHRPMLDLIEALLPVVPAGLDTFFFSNSGAEAVEGSFKLARQATGRPNLIVFQGSFHGRTVGTMSLTTSKTTYRAGYQPLMPGVFVAPFPYAYQLDLSPAAAVEFALRQLELILHSQTAPSETAAILVEPILGEGGYVVPPDGFLQGLRQICDREGILLILDEVQSGFGRTGRFFAAEHWGVVPDILVMAKGMASGFPLSGIVARRETMARWPAGAHGGTYGGNAVACAAATATIEVIQSEGLLANAQARGEQLRDGLSELQGRFPAIGDVRGLGLMVATEFTRQGRPDAALAQAATRAALARGLLLLTCGTWGNVVRWIPPLIVSAEQIDSALHTFADALATVAP